MMAFMPWTDDLLTGISEMDKQHKWLLDEINKLHHAINNVDSDDDETGEALYGFVNYTFNHFIMEEEMFNRLGYPEEEAHVAQHNKFTADVHNLMTRHEKGEPIDVKTLELLNNWLCNHIVKTDKAYIPFMAENGVI